MKTVATSARIKPRLKTSLDLKQIFLKWLNSNCRKIQIKESLIL
jgi:hypothetical protein